MRTARAGSREGVSASSMPMSAGRSSCPSHAPRPPVATVASSRCTPGHAQAGRRVVEIKADGLASSEAAIAPSGSPPAATSSAAVKDLNGDLLSGPGSPYMPHSWHDGCLFHMRKGESTSPSSASGVSSACAKLTWICPFISLQSDSSEGGAAPGCLRPRSSASRTSFRATQSRWSVASRCSRWSPGCDAAARSRNHAASGARTTSSAGRESGTAPAMRPAPAPARPTASTAYKNARGRRRWRNCWPARRSKTAARHRRAA
mmetsp:Transcript_6875/g.22072  ORF Transcript_6875/g.22072 Transcript_6875/m.22072 type:complete len:261 (-) Transcript_6875:9-791(-)